MDEPHTWLCADVISHRDRVCARACVTALLCIVYYLLLSTSGLSY
jgi:hypothetical protein